MPSNEAFSVTSKIHAVLMEVWAASVKAFGVLAHTLKENEHNRALQQQQHNATKQPEVIHFQWKAGNFQRQYGKWPLRHNKIDQNIIYILVYQVLYACNIGSRNQEEQQKQNRRIRHRDSSRERCTVCI